MRKLPLFFILSIGLIMQSCIGEDIIEDAVPEEIRFLNPVESIEASEAYQLNTRFFNNVGEEQTVEIDWSSEDPSIATVDSNGLVNGVSEGTTNIVAKAVVDNKNVENTISITITEDTSLPPVVVEPEVGEITITNPIVSINVSETYVFNAIYSNDSGEEENIEFTWSSDTPEVATVSDNGLVTGVSDGSVVITVSGVVNGEIIEEITTINVIEEVQILNEKSGVIITTSSYALQGDFTLSEIENSTDLELSIESNYVATTSLPGLYVYLTNNPNSIAGAIEIGAVTTFSGAHSYTIQGAGINDYSHVLYWCKPFGVKVGEGEINN